MIAFRSAYILESKVEAKFRLRSSVRDVVFCEFVHIESRVVDNAQIIAGE